jgi:dipeptidyl aminopeptidase/acylaminoacyl peptidase
LRSAHYLLFFVAACAPAGQLFAPGDWWDWHDISFPRINAESTSVVYVESWNLRERDRTCSNLWTVAIGGGAPRRLTDGPWRDTSPAWSRDGASIAFLSDRDGTPQIWARRLDSGADRRITSLEASRGRRTARRSFSPRGSRGRARPPPGRPPRFSRCFGAPMPACNCS